MDWSAWHAQYDVFDSALSRRLRAVQEQVRTALSTAPAGELRVVSLCAGEGRDLLDVLDGHPRRGDVRARLVELDPRNAAAARATAAHHGLDRVEVVTGDAALTDHYAELAPAHLVLACGIFGNIDDADIERTVAACEQLCRSGGTVIWTRHREAPDLVPQICAWFEQRGFERHWVSPADAGFGVGVHRFTGTPRRLEKGVSLFTFRGYDELRRGTARQNP
ncbi:hypothetical protein ABH931_001530 [Streptacidiphilus sp. MAP12-33]|uniref:class I SAM-dependent methyltransferase n=1 Tax=Streptacidiphilus sp. MAP12-33 TaxID=3156266 RepID=UPI003516C310